MEYRNAANDASSTLYLRVWLLLAIIWVFTVVWLSFEITHAVFSRAPHNWPYLAVTIPLLLAPWLLRRFESARSRAMKG